jgi:hypothetical protein
MPGNFTLIVGDEDAKSWLHAAPGAVNTWLRDLVGDTVDFSADRLRAHAPGGIDALVESDRPSADVLGPIEGVAGVLPDITQETFNRGLGSDPADYPVFVDVGTGIFGERGTPIRTIPGHVMVIDFPEGKLFTNVIRGQPGQHYSDRAFEETVGWLPGRLEVAVREFSAESKAHV